MKIPDSEHYRQDEHGEWWYYPGKDRQRTRAKIKVCARCGEEYLISVYRAKASRFCTRQCSGATRRGKTTGRGPDGNRWKGGKTTRHGYVMIFAPDHPTCQGNQRKYVAEHRLVMEKKLGRFLTSSEYVHHINGDKKDNRVENLEIIGASEHAQRHRYNHFQSGGSAPHCPTCTCGE